MWKGGQPFPSVWVRCIYPMVSSFLPSLLLSVPTHHWSVSSSPSSSQTRSPLSSYCPKRLSHLVTQQHLRMSIGVYYLIRFGRQIKRSWGGQGGVISAIRKVWNIPQTHSRYIKRILTRVNELQLKNVPYTGQSGQQLGGSGRKPLIQQGSMEEQIIADWMEQGLGFRQTTKMVNQHRRDQGLTLVGRSAVRNHFEKMNPVISRTQKICQGNSNNKGWIDARKRQCEQFCIMFNKLTTEDLLREHKTFPLPLCFEPSRLPRLHPDQIVWFDETHIEQEGGAASRTGVQIRFPRDPTGQFSPLLDNPSYNPMVKQQTFKFTSEGRFCLGVAIVLDGNQKYIGKKAKLFDYTGKKIDTIKVYAQLVSHEIQRVKNLNHSGKSSPWLIDSRPKNDEFWYEDDLSYLPGMGEKTLRRIREVNPTIMTISDFITALETQHTTLTQIKGVPKFISLTKQAKPGSSTYRLIDHRQSPNPYQSRYGEGWEKVIKTTTALSSHTCIKDLVLHMVRESQRIMNGTRFEKNWYFYHDALSQLTAKDTREWMSNTVIDGVKIIDRWLVPQNNVSLNTPYHQRPVGNSPEFMPLDNSLNNDIQSSHLHHCIVTSHLPPDDIRKHSLATPNMISRGMTRIWDNPDGPPSSSRIVHDVLKAIDAMKAVYEAKGSMVPGLCDRNGIRADAVGSSKQGGVRVKKEILEEESWLEPYAAAAFKERKDNIKSRFLMQFEVDDDSVNSLSDDDSTSSIEYD